MPTLLSVNKRSEKELWENKKEKVKMVLDKISTNGRLKRAKRKVFQLQTDCGPWGKGWSSTSLLRYFCSASTAVRSTYLPSSTTAVEQIGEQTEGREGMANFATLLYSGGSKSRGLQLANHKNTMNTMD